MKRKTLTPFIIALTGLLFLLVVGFGYLMKQTPVNSVATSTSMLRYTNMVYGITFDYPDRYDASTTESPNPDGSKNLNVILVEKGTVVPPNADGPTAITLSIFPNALAKITKENKLETWITTSPYSNFKTSQLPSPLPTVLANKDARTYTWDGLYPGLSIVTNEYGNIYMISLTYNGPSDTVKLTDYNALLQTVRFITPATSATRGTN